EPLEVLDVVLDLLAAADAVEGRNKADGVVWLDHVVSPLSTCHCEERSDEAISHGRRISKRTRLLRFARNDDCLTMTARPRCSAARRAPSPARSGRSPDRPACPRRK